MTVAIEALSRVSFTSERIDRLLAAQTVAASPGDAATDGAFLELRRGIGRLLSTRATEMVFELVHHLPRKAVDKAANGLVRPLCDGLTKYAGASWKGAAALTASAVRTTPLATAAGFLPGLKRYDEYGVLSSITANTIVISGGADLATPVAHARDMVAAIPGAAHLHRPDAGHMLLQEHPQCVNGAIDRILEMQTDSTLGAAS